ncbi:hypothetical protein B296_00025051 [Ensete ventricosum]|uniref:Uncharacterized protein n=1 Tax=Ensete ventricosum TaxID=4639 RepID=A0A426ZU55_ENSVE|nr:hypothetical protein B296_00025051 [Ensete ventricosum]
MVHLTGLSLCTDQLSVWEVLQDQRYSGLVIVSVFFARLILAEMNKELKGLRFLNSSNLIKLRVTIVAVGELELSNECNLMQWSAEDFEAKLQVSSLRKELYSLPFQASTVLMYQNLDMMKQTYERSLKAASEYGYLKDNPE